ncbi:MAG: PhnD/SsuA/transferrin family substrate-binding protein [Polyangiaceae bacterium]|nr:PhnD/SsuA/transferrin family substrate-binding protein [Polyangiaceae bacterium]
MPSPSALAPGTLIADRYRVLRPISRSARSALVVAEHLGLGREVALRVLAPELAGSSEAMARFAREARAIAALDSPHVARVFDVGQLPSGAPFLVLELLDGVDLAALSRETRLPVAEAVELIVQACAGLAAAHAAGIVHRDVRPSHLFLTQTREGAPSLKVLGFGVAKFLESRPDDVELTDARSRLGALGYGSPEQLRDARDVDARTDVWSLGVVLHELLMGELPFRATSLHGLAIEIASDDPRPVTRADVPREIVAAVARCLARGRDLRFASVVALASALGPFGGPRASALAARLQPIATEPTTPAPAPPARPRARLRLGVIERATTRAAELEAGLAETLGEACELVPVASYRALVELLRDREIELAWLPPLAFLRARAARAAHLLATIERGGAPSFGCAILGRAAGPTTLEGVRGLRAAWTDPWSASGYVVPRAMLRQAGIDPEAEFPVELFVGGARAVVAALREGAADVGPVHCVLAPSGTLVSGPWSEADGLRVLGLGGPVPCDALCAGPSLDAARRAEARRRLLSPAPSLLAGLEATGTRDPDARLYELFRLAFLS